MVRRIGLAAAVAVAVVNVSCAAPMQSNSFASPFAAYDGRGKRRAPGWSTQGTARVKMGAVALTQPLPNEFGSLWGIGTANLGEEFSFETKFRFSSSRPRNGGGSLAWFLVSDSLKADYEKEFFGVDKTFQGLALVFDADHAEASGDLRKGTQKLSLYASNGKDAPVELGSCFKTVYYDEARDDFMPSLASSLRLSYFSDGRVLVDVDARNTQSWQRCINTRRVQQMLPAELRGWRQRSSLGMVARTGTKSGRFELSSFRLYNKADDAREMSQPDWNGDGGDRALKIAHQLEHGLFEVKDSIERMLARVRARADRDVDRISELEQKLATSAFALMETRLEQVESKLTSVQGPIMDARVRQVEARFNHKLEMFKWETDKDAYGWLRPFLVILIMLAAFAYYSHREYRAMNKWNKQFM